MSGVIVLGSKAPKAQRQGEVGAREMGPHDPVKNADPAKMTAAEMRAAVGGHWQKVMDRDTYAHYPSGVEVTRLMLRGAATMLVGPHRRVTPMWILDWIYLMLRKGAVW